MAEIRSHRDLVVWQKAMDLAVEVYRIVRALPDAERFGLISQLSRAATSIPANIAEGHGRMGSREYANFLSIARGSLKELETLLELAVRVGYVPEDDTKTALSIADEVGRMLTTLIQRLRP